MPFQKTYQFLIPLTAAERLSSLSCHSDKFKARLETIQTSGQTITKYLSAKGYMQSWEIMFWLNDPDNAWNPQEYWSKQ